MMIALMQDLLVRHPYLTTIFNFDDSHSAQLREQLPFLVNRFRINLNKNDVIGTPFVLPCDGSMPFYWESMLSLRKSILPLSENMNLHIEKHTFAIEKHTSP